MDVEDGKGRDGDLQGGRDDKARHDVTTAGGRVEETLRTRKPRLRRAAGKRMQVEVLSTSRSRGGGGPGHK